MKNKKRKKKQIIRFFIYHILDYIQPQVEGLLHGLIWATPFFTGITALVCNAFFPKIHFPYYYVIIAFGISFLAYLADYYYTVMLLKIMPKGDTEIIYFN